jgi:hypothetical protein
MVVHILIPAIEKASGSRPDGSKTKQDSISTNKMGVVAHICHPSNMGSLNRRTAVQASLSKKQLKQKGLEA